MKRGYTVALYDEMLDRIRETVPDAAVSSDFIVGFCGETEASFQKSVRPGRAVPVQEQLHLQVQPQARHQGRHAPDRRRARGGQEAAERRAAGPPERHQPRGPPGLRRPDGRGPGRGAEQVGVGRARPRASSASSSGRTWCDRIVVFEGPGRLIGQFLPVEVERASTVTLYGRAVTPEVVAGESSGA